MSRSLTWKGRTWEARQYSYDQTTGGSPGPCFYEDDNVWVGGDGYLHMAITRAAIGWLCAELRTGPLGFGTYVWTIQTPLNNLDPNIIVGLFPHQQYRKCQYTNEIDIEFCKWSDNRQANRVQYSVSPNNDGSACNVNTKYPPQGEYYPIYVNCSQNEPAKAKSLVCTMVWAPEYVAFGGKYTDGEVFTDINTYRWQTNAGGATPSAGPFRYPWNHALVPPAAPMPVYFGQDTIPQMDMMCMMDLWLTGADDSLSTAEASAAQDFYTPANFPGGFEIVITDFSYTPLGVEPPEPAYLNITTTPVSGAIFIDGVQVPPGQVEVEPGSYQVSFGSVTGYTTPPPQTVSVTAGQTRNVVGTYIPIQGLKKMAVRVRIMRI